MWAMERQGQVIICENTRASWMNFKPMITQNVMSGKYQEAIWSNLPIAFDNEQMKLL